MYDEARDRWFYQHVPSNNRVVDSVDVWNQLGEPDYDNWSSQIDAVFAICLKKGNDYLIFAFAQTNAKTDVEVQVWNGPTVTIPRVTRDGVFYHVKEDSPSEELDIGRPGPLGLQLEDGRPLELG